MTLKPDPKAKKQAAAFRKAARELGADASDETFQNTLKILGRAKPKSDEEIKRTVRSARTSKS